MVLIKNATPDDTDFTDFQKLICVLPFPLGGDHGGQRFGRRLIDANRLVQAGQIENLPVVLAQPTGQKSLLLALGCG